MKYSPRLKSKLKLFRLELRYHKKILKLRHWRKGRKFKYLYCIVFRRCTKEGQCGGGRALFEHSNCGYVEELLNYNYCCRACHDEINSNYQEWWDEYNASRI